VVTYTYISASSLVLYPIPFVTKLRMLYVICDEYGIDCDCYRTNDYKIKMQNLEFTENIPKCGHRKRCPYVTKAPFYMVNHVKRHRLPLESSRCERNDLEKYYCKDCNLETDLVVILKQHFRECHRKDVKCVQDQPKNDTVVKCYICQKCSFKTYSVLLWIKHLESSCFNAEKECENVHTVSCSDEEWHRSECCSFKTKEARVLKK
ncbi:unnamed protein product, partial [Tenebrio molitor]